MMFRCLSQFDIKDEEEPSFPSEDLTNDERQSINEQQEAKLPQFTSEPISDNEEGESDFEVNCEADIQRPSERALGKRRRSTASEQTDNDYNTATQAVNLEEEEDDDEEAGLSLPPIPHAEGRNSQRRTSGRVRKRSRWLEDTISF
jgi:hypothetical protein